jgi:hypothetical protein
MQPAIKEEEIVVTGEPYTVRIIGYERKPITDSEEEWKLHQINCLPTVRKISNEGKIKLFTYTELRHEAWKRPDSFPNNLIGDIFSDIDIEEIDAAVERSYFFQGSSDDIFSKDKVIKFCKWLLDIDHKILTDKISNQSKFPSFLLENLENAERFKVLCDNISEKQYIDAFHLWTGEVNNMRYFLTTDKKFINVMTKTKKIDLPCEPISPSQLLDRMDVNELESFRYSEDKFYDIFGNSK